MFENETTPRLKEMFKNFTISMEIATQQKYEGGFDTADEEHLKNVKTDRKKVASILIKRERERIEHEEDKRVCDITGEIMTDGYVFNDCFYIKYQQHAISYAQKHGYQSLSASYLDGFHYYTEWED